METKMSENSAKKPIINPEKVLLKMSMFLVFGGTMSLIPYLTIHMQSLGLTVEEIATIYLTLLFTTFLSPPITGFFVDRFGKYKPVIMLCLILDVASHNALNYIPKRAKVDVLPDNFIIHVGRDTVDIKWESCHKQICTSGKEIEPVLEFCMNDCYLFDANFANESSFLIENNDFPSAFQLKEMNYSSGNDNSCSLKYNKTSQLFPGCLKDCKVNLNSTALRSNVPKTTLDLTFWLYLGTRFIATMMLQSSYSLLDAAAFNMVEKYGGDFGKEKLFSSVGIAIFPPLTGLMIDYFSEGLKIVDYSSAFYTFDALLILSLVSVFMMPIGEKLPSEDVYNNLSKVMKMSNVVIFIAFLFFMGIFCGFFESYFFVIMKEIGSPNYLLGLAYTVGTVVSIPLMYYTGPLTNWIGHINLLVLAFFAISLRLISYSIISNPFWCLIIEFLEAVSCYFMWAVATTFCDILAPKDLTATLLGVATMVYYCLGKGSGSFIGGIVIGQVGTKMAFKIIGTTGIGFAIAYKLVHIFYLKKFDKNTPDK